MLGLWVLLLVLGPYSLAEELITCAKACDSCGGPFPLDEQEIYCEMCRECGTTTFTELLITTAATIASSRAPDTTKSRNRRSGSEETVTRRVGNHVTSNSAIRCNGEHKCFYIDKLSKRKIEFFCPEQVVPFCDEIKFEKKEITIAGGLSTRLLCPPSLYCKERPPTTTTKTTTTLLTTTTTTTTVPPRTPTSIYARRMQFQMPPMQIRSQMFRPQMPPPQMMPQHMMAPHMMPQLPMQQPQMPPPHMPFFQQPMPMMMQQPAFPYFEQQQQLPPNFFPQPHPAQVQSYPLLTDSKDIRRLEKIMSNAEGPSGSDYLEHEGNYLETNKQLSRQGIKRGDDIKNKYLSNKL